MSKFFTITFLLIFLSNLSKASHECSHGRHPSNMKSYETRISSLRRKFLQPEKKSVGPIRIHADYSNFDNKDDHRLFDIINHAIDFFKKRLRVQQSSSPIKIPTSKCSVADVPAEHREIGVNADLVIYFSDRRSWPHGHDASVSCVQDPSNGRPIAGYINIPSSRHYNDIPSAELFEDFVKQTIHLFTHVIAFDKNLFSHFRKSFGSNEVRPISETLKKGFYGQDYLTILTTPKVVEIGRKHFNCHGLEGLPLEDLNQTSSDLLDFSSHWEREIFLNEGMTIEPTDDLAFSEFTLALFQDSGWYQVDFKYAEPLYIGKNAGCEFFKRPCAKTPGMDIWCSELGLKSDELKCTETFKKRGLCLVDPYTRGCRRVMSFTNYKNYRDQEEVEFWKREEDWNCERFNGGSSYKPGLLESYDLGSRCFEIRLLRNSSHVNTNDVLMNKTHGSPRTRIRSRKSYEKDPEIENYIGSWAGKLNPSSYCFQYVCNDGELKIKVNHAEDRVCSYPGETLIFKYPDPYIGYFFCPNDFTAYCNPMYKFCPNKCSLNGYCNNGVCDCIDGWTGKNCSVKVEGNNSSVQTGSKWISEDVLSNLFNWYQKPTPPKEWRVNERIRLDKEKKLGVGAIIGIVVGVIVVVVIVVLGVIYFIKKRKSNIN